MRIDLPNGQWAELRDPDRLTGGDRRAVKAAIRIRIRPGDADGLKEQEVGADVQERRELALLRRLIVSWSVTNPVNGQMFPIPLSQPADDPNPVLDELPLEVYDALIEAIQPHMDRLDKAGKSSTASVAGSSDGQQPGTQPVSVPSPPTS